MPSVIDITNQFPATRERTVLLELLRVVRSLQDEGIEVVICGGCRSRLCGATSRMRFG
jgi:hypothetical protein